MDLNEKANLYPKLSPESVSPPYTSSDSRESLAEELHKPNLSSGKSMSRHLWRLSRRNSLYAYYTRACHYMPPNPTSPSYLRTLVAEVMPIDAYRKERLEINIAYQTADSYSASGVRGQLRDLCS
ncbi:unnamed protein product [Schistocephalus solidus]|uniref:Uncharacterized protein n=1 Tax=Schistocephalus solidus TaxID=70667 RepID=A0A183T3G0_SCHSO|nr:unnamed protein product [Schistocephalus solidus]